MGKSDTQIKCGACGEWSWIPVDFFPENARNIIYRGLQCPKCDFVTLLVSKPGEGIGIVDSTPTFAVTGRAFGYYFPPFPFIPEDLEELTTRTLKARKKTKKNKRRWKIVYKGKMKEENESTTRRTTKHRKVT